MVKNRAAPEEAGGVLQVAPKQEQTERLCADICRLQLWVEAVMVTCDFY